MVSFHTNGLLNLPAAGPFANSIHSILDVCNMHYHSLQNDLSKLHIYNVLVVLFIIFKFLRDLLLCLETQS